MSSVFPSQDPSEIIKDLREENSRLLDQLSDAHLELSELRKLKTSATDFVIPESADLREAKILDLAKKNRDLRMNLSKEKGKNATLQKEIEKLQDECQGLKETQAFQIESGGDGSADNLKDKLSRANNKLIEARAEMQSLKQELSKTQRALKKEVGEGVSINSLLHDGSNWRGRAQEISLLKEKVKELKEELASVRMGIASASRDEILTNTDGGTIGSDISEAEKRALRELSAAMDGGLNEGREEDEMIGGGKRGGSTSGASERASVAGGAGKRKDFAAEHRTQIEEARQKKLAREEEKKQAVEELEAMVHQLKQRVESVKARNKILEDNQFSMNEKFQTIVAKTKNDDEFIQALQAQNQVLKRKLAQAQTQSQTPSSKASSTSSSSLSSSAELAEAREKTLMQERKIARQEQIIKSLRSELDALTAQMMDESH
ncbi:putative Coiled-coil domain-containing protein 13 [Monocercomonoides exilis]|uniref:putative Coiled-coil domain-containing protein 13 n=1 Tax=Monocercomonoides exilis TaxID=2049356 RepID=UPI00355ABD64|nr:putative Coiled-coil domain-containing protein 13 [Monocercomonoides exilis]|eukprot:MONOS_4304.1-p1 / transcript=MONOS_4304.1 / gene=MONOS_4304 / organism=Monocercomonoides_exilis_PA203 / gene_product=Coiled-coil domain-containing protein 13 / transcript_product=Coiled-coil domain-containing protein 13 / location=Mono_scaffold00112:115992-117501(+) / protein_length=433 / sequence_SO=supercontig / SO=protein_coding / is_pseudo=false